MIREDCRTVTLLLLDHVYRDLEEVWTHRVERHLADCAECRERHARLRETLELVDRATVEPEERISEQFAATVLAILQRRRADESRPRLRAAMAACLVLGLLAPTLRVPPLPKATAPNPPPAVVELQLVAKELNDPLLEELAWQTAQLSARVQSVGFRTSRPVS